jgi:hypothetical protein
MKSAKSDLIVFFTGYTEGFVVRPCEEEGQQWDIGDYKDNWAPIDDTKEWVYYEGTFECSNGNVNSEEEDG